ncbi:MAG: TIR domain-containing protein [Clostridia bacterium]|nr:TIR domain-containing protein [Clostridia bacterium]
MEAFVSWTGADRDVKNALVEKLQEAGINCWDSDENCVSDFSSECIEAIKCCEVFIVIISESSMKKGYVKNEVITARALEDEGKLNILVYKITDKPYTSGFEFLINHVSFAFGNLIERKESFVEESGIDTVVKRATILLQKRREGNPEKPFDVNIPQIDGLKIAKTGFFVENSRNEILESIDQKLRENNVIILKELFGFGKKSTIKKFAELHSYENVVVVDNETNGLRDFILSELEFRNVNQKVFEALEGNELIKEKFRLLQKLDEKNLLIVPDVKFEAAPDEFICQNLLSLSCKIVLITQEEAGGYSEYFPVINLGRMKDEHLLELFYHYYPYAYEEDKELLYPHLINFFSGIGGHTKTIELTASVLSREMGVHPEEIPQYLSLRGNEGMQLKDKIMSQISYLFSMESLSEEEIKILLVASYIAVPRISEGNFRKALKSCGINDWSLVMKLDKLRWLDVDIMSRSVSVEPLIAKIVTSTYPENYFIIYNCLSVVLENVAKICVNSHTYSKLCCSIETALNNMGFCEAAQIIAVLRQYSNDKENFDLDIIKQALANYESKYSTEYCSEAVEDMVSEDDYTLCLCEEYIKTAMTAFITLTKLVASNVETELLYNFSQESQSMFLSGVGSGERFFDIEQLLGLSKEDLYGFLETFRAEKEQEGGFDEEDEESYLLLQALAATDAFYNRDIAEFMRIFESMNDLIDQAPIFENDDNEVFVYSIYFIVATIYMNMKAYRSVISLCERVMKRARLPLVRTFILNAYIEALQHLNEYGEKLYASYEEVLKCFNETSGDAFESRDEANAEKKIRVLNYARDLAKGEQGERAVYWFKEAQKLGKMHQPTQTVRTAKKIAELLFATCDFSVVTEFINTYFSCEYIEALRAVVDEYDGATLDEFTAYKKMMDTKGEEGAEEDETRYISYYHQYSRENNSLQERAYRSVAERVSAFDFSQLTNAEIKEHALSLKARAKREKLLALASECFALASEAGFRVLGYRHHYVQYMGAAAMADGKVAEILNGEGKTYTIVLVAFLNYIFGRKVFVLDSSPFLTKRNHEWMHGVYSLLGMSSEHIEYFEQFYKRNGKQQADVTYITVRQLIFGQLESELEVDFKREDMKLGCAIIDEIDSVIVDEAVRPYDLVKNTGDSTVVEICEIAYRLAQELAFDEDCYSYESKRIDLKQGVCRYIERAFGVSYDSPADIEKIGKIEEALTVALLCCNHFERGVDYHLQKGVPVYENTQNGIFADFSPMYEYFLARLNDLSVSRAQKELSTGRTVLNSTCVKDLINRFDRVCGTTATAASFKKEFKEIYDLDYVAIPPFAPCIRENLQSPVFMNEEAKKAAILETVVEKHQKGQPILIITQTVEESEEYSRRLKAVGIEHKVLNAKNSDDSTDIIALSGEMNSVLVATFIINRGTDIKLGGNAEIKTRRELVNMGVDVTGLEELIYAVPTEEQKESPLYKKYYALLEKNRLLVEMEKEKVVASGGLCVIGTSFFLELRTEQQTRGRSGRQGEVGESIVFRSIEDGIIRRSIGEGFVERLQSMATDDMAIHSNILNKALQNLRQRIHDKHFSDIRAKNKRSAFIDAGRRSFLEVKNELYEGKATVVDIIHQWSQNESVKKEILLFQKGIKNNQRLALYKLYLRHKDRLSAAKGINLERRLFDAFMSETEELFAKEGDNKEIMIVHFLLKEGFERYIETVDKTLKNVEASDRSLERFFRQERNRLFASSVERLLKMKA